MELWIRSQDRLELKKVKDIVIKKDMANEYYKIYGKYGKDANKSKPIYQYDLQGNFIKKWDSQKDVERELGFRQNCISNCALGRCKSSYGYVWRLNYE